MYCTMKNSRQLYSPWLHRFAILTAVATFILIFVGGIVTSTDSGLAVPDWPTTFGYSMFLYPLSKTVSGFLFSLDPNLQVDLENGTLSEALRKALERNEISVSGNIKISTSEQDAKWKIEDVENQRTYTVIRADNRLDIYVPGVLYEHSHRLIGSVVGILTITLMLLIWIKDSRRWMRWLSAVALVSVIAQGVMGGLRVVHISQMLAIVHGCFAQAFFAVTAGFVLFTSREWIESSGEIPITNSLRWRRLSLLTTLLIYLQLIFGAVLRHTGTRLDAHILFAVLVTIHVFLLARCVLRDGLEYKSLVRTTVTLTGLLALQLMLGIGAYVGKFTLFAETMPTAAMTIATTHVAVGALMLITSCVLTLKIYKSTEIRDSIVDGGGLLSKEVSA